LRKFEINSVYAGKRLADWRKILLLAIDSATGMYRGEFTLTVDDEWLTFTFLDCAYERDALFEGSDAHVRFGNLIVPEKPQPLLTHDLTDITGEVAAIKVPATEINLVSDTALYEFAMHVGPLFGEHDGATLDAVVREPKEAWLMAAKNMNFALRAQAVCDHRAEDDWLDDELTWLYYDLGDGNFTWIVRKNFSVTLPEPYRSLLDYPESEGLGGFNKSTFSVRGHDAMGLGVSTWNVSDAAGGGPPALRRLSTTNIAKPFSVAKAVYLLSNRYMRSSSTNIETRDTMTRELEKAIVEIHARGIRFSWAGDIFAPTFANVLERLWYAAGLSCSKGKVGLCEYCGKLFTADAERKSKKRFCSPECQNRAKSKRQVARRQATESTAQATK
jgi:hypothetical protein